MRWISFLVLVFASSASAAPDPGQCLPLPKTSVSIKTKDDTTIKLPLVLCFYKPDNGALLCQYEDAANCMVIVRSKDGKEHPARCSVYLVPAESRRAPAPDGSLDI